MISFRLIQNNDILDVLNIYNKHILNGFANFEENPIDKKDFEKLIAEIDKLNLPFVVSLNDNKVVGFAYLNKYRDKSGYKHAFENSIYIDEKFLGKGIGCKLLNELISYAKENKNIKSIIAVIGSKDSDASICIHKKNNFDIIGTLKNIGFKKNTWLDSIIMQKLL